MKNVAIAITAATLLTGCGASMPSMEYSDFHSFMATPKPAEQVGYWTHNNSTFYLQPSGEGVQCWAAGSVKITRIKMSDTHLINEFGYKVDAPKWDGQQFYTDYALSDRITYYRDADLSRASLYCKENLPKFVK